MQSRWFARISFVMIPMIVVAVATFVTSSTAEARGSRSPYVKTPWGVIPKSVYNAPYVHNSQKLEQYRQAEQKMQGKYGVTAQPTPTTKKK